MYIVVTDCGHFWNHENPILKKYKESVIVVCLNGKKVTDEYRCFVSPYYGNMMGQMFGQVPFAFEREEYKVLEEHFDELYREYTGCSNSVVLENLLKLKKRIPPEKIRIRVPYIPNYNTNRNVEKSVKWVRNNLGVEAEQFRYFVTGKK